MKRKVATLLLLALGLGAAGGSALKPTGITVEGRCYEDEVIVGFGDFTPGKGWDVYQCVPADDL